jgi:hypothetical protein
MIGLNTLKSKTERFRIGSHPKNQNSTPMAEPLDDIYEINEDRTSETGRVIDAQKFAKSIKWQLVWPKETAAIKAQMRLGGTLKTENISITRHPIFTKITIL